jgi:hypothetical protein
MSNSVYKIIELVNSIWPWKMERLRRTEPGLTSRLSTRNRIR